MSHNKNPDWNENSPMQTSYIEHKPTLGTMSAENASNYPTNSTMNSALAGKEPTITGGLVTQFWTGIKTWVAITKATVGLGNVDNTSDANKPVSTAQAASIATKMTIPTGSASTQYVAGDGTLKTNANIPAAQVQADWTQTNNASVDYIKNRQTTKKWTGTFTSGTCIIYLTNNGLVGGTAWYTSIESIMLAFNINDNNLGKTHTISGDLKTLTITATQQSFTGIFLLSTPILGSVNLNAVPNGTAINAVICGTPA